jgi:hypothetical protein
MISRRFSARSLLVPAALLALPAFAGTKLTDIESRRPQGRNQRGVVELGIMRQRDNRAARGQRCRGEGFVRPFMRKRGARKAFLGRECRAWIDDSHRVIGQ